MLNVGLRFGPKHRKIEWESAKGIKWRSGGALYAERDLIGLINAGSKWNNRFPLTVCIGRFALMVLPLVNAIVTSTVMVRINSKYCNVVEVLTPLTPYKSWHFFSGVLFFPTFWLCFYSCVMNLICHLLGLIGSHAFLPALNDIYFFRNQNATKS